LLIEFLYTQIHCFSEYYKHINEFISHNELILINHIFYLADKQR